MALLTDDCDLETTYLRTSLGGNGDYYIEVTHVENGLLVPKCVRISTSGGICKDSDVKIAVANLFRAMEKAGLNEYPKVI